MNILKVLPDNSVANTSILWSHNQKQNILNLHHFEAIGNLRNLFEPPLELPTFEKNTTHPGNIWELAISCL